MSYPDNVSIAGVPHSVIYVNKASDVDFYGRDSLWGQHDPWTKSIRIYKNGNPRAAVLKVLLHEMIHGYGVEFGLHQFTSHAEESEENTSAVERIIFDMLGNNPWLLDMMEALYNERADCADLSL